MALEIARMLVLSTGHLTNGTCNKRLPGDAALGVVGAYEKAGYGWFVHVGDSSKELSVDLAACLDFARRRGVDWVMFDRDGPQIDALPYYAWGEN